MATTDASSWVRAVRASHDRLAGLVAGLDGAALRTQSYDTEWSVADVLSHLGSGAEISALYLEAGVAGGDPPSFDDFKPIWDTWNARSPEEQAAQSVIANEAYVTRVESLTAEERAAFSVLMFGRMSVDLAGALGMRLSEHALHTWDVAVTFDPAARIAPDAVDLLIDRLPLMAGFMGKQAPARRGRRHHDRTGPCLHPGHRGRHHRPGRRGRRLHRIADPARRGIHPLGLRPPRQRRRPDGLGRDALRTQVGLPRLLTPTAPGLALPR